MASTLICELTSKFNSHIPPFVYKILGRPLLQYIVKANMSKGKIAYVWIRRKIHLTEYPASDEDQQLRHRKTLQWIRP